MCVALVRERRPKGGAKRVGLGASVASPVLADNFCADLTSLREIASGSQNLPLCQIYSRNTLRELVDLGAQWDGQLVDLWVDWLCGHGGYLSGQVTLVCANILIARYFRILVRP